MRRWYVAGKSQVKEGGKKKTRDVYIWLATVVESPDEFVAPTDVFDVAVFGADEYLGNGEMLVRSLTVARLHEHSAEAGAVTVHEAGFIGYLILSQGFLGAPTVRTAGPYEHYDDRIVRRGTGRDGWCG